jgi:transposase-like protein
MSIMTLQVPPVKSICDNRPTQCPYCPGQIFQRWGGLGKAVRDPHLKEVWIYRYRCCGCKRTFRQYPQGVDRADQTQRLRILVAIGWSLGLSYRGLVAFLGLVGVSLERMSGWRDVQAQADTVGKLRYWGKVRVLGLDGAYVRGWGQTQPVLVAVDLGNAQPVAIGYVEEHNPQAVKRFLAPLMQRLGVSVIITDDLVSYKVAAEELGLEQQICQFHVRRWVGRTLKELIGTAPAEWQGVIDEVGQILRDLPRHGDRRLLELWRQIPASRTDRRNEPLSALERLRLVLVRLAQDWDKYRVFEWDKEVPWTNNITEQVIGRMKMRARTVRGYKNRPGMHNGLLWSATRLD